MAIKTILVPLSGLPGRGQWMDAVIRLSREWDAHLETLHVAMDPRDSVAYVGEGMTSAMIGDVMAVAERESDERRQEAQKVFEDACQRNGVTISDQPDSGPRTAHFTIVTGREEDVVASRGRLADLIFARRPEGGGEEVTFSVTLEAALLDTGRPVLILPPSDPVEFGSSIAIYWNGSPEAGKAINYAMPFLEKADRVSVIEVDAENHSGPGTEDVTNYLAWHGVRAEGRDLERKGSDSESLLAATSAAGADMLVMGAYTRSRLRRLVFGGVTRDVLTRSAVPVLMAH
ncbi:MAG: universal stress protein [Alphaproteobacteria bacterium]|nr:universal stress protein [Alphaproteobacteria bacterium]MCY4497026.1 universal stress protein [Rhodospirillaceae bacterium]